MNEFAAATLADRAMLFPCLPIQAYEILKKRRLNSESSKLVHWNVRHGDIVREGDVIAEFMAKPVKSSYISDRQRGLLGFLRGRRQIRPYVVAPYDGLVSLGSEECAEWSKDSSVFYEEQDLDTFLSEKKHVFFGLQRLRRDGYMSFKVSLLQVYKQVVRYCFSVIEGEAEYSLAEEERLSRVLNDFANSANAVVPIGLLRDG
ncbi:MAG: biotin/lipoyl-binding protein [Planctomycetota bacterium]